ncbi:TlpA family protein disulfide reductase [Ferruginibacter sp. SUN106]|uniref:TlpA family protein disulfide reductase n=1 Tax=Ferruginibacter sp. SUN106 TaxID=2978348 RepID=UPI003D35F0D1
MKQLLLSAIAFALISIATAQVKFEALTITPQFPKAGQTVSFKYNKQLSPLIDEKKIDIVVYLLDGTEYKVIEPKAVQAGTTFSGSFKLGDKTKCFAFTFSSDKEKDINASKGYFVPVYNSKNEPVPEYYSTLYNIQRFYGEDYFGITFNAQKVFSIIEEGLKQHPELKNDPTFFNTYLSSLNGAKKGEAIPVIKEELLSLENKGNLTEKDYNTLIQWYTRDKRKGKVDTLTTAMKVAFPNGDWKNNEALTKFYAEKDLVKKVALYNDYVTQYPPTEENKVTIDRLKSQLANAYAKAKDYKSYNEWNQKLSKAMAASNDNNIAWAMAEANENIEEAKKMSLSATSYAKAENLKPTEKKPDYFTTKQWTGSRKSQYGMYADTYAFIMYQTGDFKTGLPYAKDAAAASDYKNAEYNERYSQLMEKVLPPAMVKKEIEQFVKDGAASSKTKAILKTLYVAEKKSDAGYDDYLTKLEMTARMKKREEMAKTMTNDPAPKFSLKDLEGNDVSLEGLKGKVVIVDFWATWCGPCIASMPAMKTVQEKLKARDDVAFVFVDTWQTEADKKQNAIDFLKKNNYPFHVLLDNEDKVVSEFKVNGIPTKFVIDKTGNIRFKSVGFGGNDDALIDEVDMMVEMAAADFPVDRHVK